MKLGMPGGLFGLNIATLMTAVVVAGCGGADPGNKAVAKVHGKVTVDGAPVSGGSLIFSPLGDGKSNLVGKAGQAIVKADGTYSVSTYGNDDGAVIGKHKVLYSPPPSTVPAAAHAPGADTPHAAPADPLAGLTPDPGEVTVNSGDNNLEIKLSKKP